ncbi:PaaI family thioesterase [Gluconacetobacter diazotrophicus]|uniref:Putative thioesterase superfamily protein n=1 Tax=Gluconacetobacter diazotrophicus (strain ATCC 49037 / DSM 5601 / CCUG 37298 / CIP 103539 / LMG 7603 / PAl5) TaxID=272568 RepID=A9HDH2_GLUDA|nr:PaaI family thioesterase [Gluconacetobacter diazotrophicus]CAP55101.1 putative thioesterase superfamily protein [Gluconacetobacter diazotrophicus PA1 5]
MAPDTDTDTGKDALPPPPGFIPMPEPFPGGFNTASGGFLVGLEAGELIGGFRVTTAFCNRGGICHGGKLATVCDVYLALAALFREDLRTDFLPTVSLGLDFLTPVAHGAWVELRSETLRITRSLVFVQGLATVEGTPAVRANATYHRTPQRPDAVPDTGAMLRALLEHAIPTRGGVTP